MPTQVFIPLLPHIKPMLSSNTKLLNTTHSIRHVSQRKLTETWCSTWDTGATESKTDLNKIDVAALCRKPIIYQRNKFWLIFNKSEKRPVKTKVLKVISLSWYTMPLWSIDFFARFVLPMCPFVFLVFSLLSVSCLSSEGH